MARLAACILISLSAMLFPTDVRSEDEPTLNCSYGPISKTYGGTTQWLVYGCNDEHSLAIMSQQGNPAGPFYFMFHWEQTQYRLLGEGTGNRKASDLAFTELKALTEAGIQALLAETQRFKPAVAAP